MRSDRRWYVLLGAFFVALAGLYYYTAIWRHRITIVDWHSSPVYALPDHGVPGGIPFGNPLPPLEPGETFLVIFIHRRIQDNYANLNDIRVLRPDGSVAAVIGIPFERIDEDGRRIMELAFVVPQREVDAGGLKLKYLDEDAIEIQAPRR